MNGGASQLTIYGTSTGANKRKHKGQTFKSLFSQCPFSGYFNAATTWILQVQAAGHKKWELQRKFSVLSGLNS